MVKDSRKPTNVKGDGYAVQFARCNRKHLHGSRNNLAHRILHHEACVWHQRINAEDQHARRYDEDQDFPDLFVRIARGMVRTRSPLG